MKKKIYIYTITNGIKKGGKCDIKRKTEKQIEVGTEFFFL